MRIDMIKNFYGCDLHPAALLDIKNGRPQIDLATSQCFGKIDSWRGQLAVFNFLMFKSAAGCRSHQKRLLSCLYTSFEPSYAFVAQLASS